MVECQRASEDPWQRAYMVQQAFEWDANIVKASTHATEVCSQPRNFVVGRMDEECVVATLSIALDRTN